MKLLPQLILTSSSFFFPLLHAQERLNTPVNSAPVLQLNEHASIFTDIPAQLHGAQSIQSCSSSSAAFVNAKLVHTSALTPPFGTHGWQTSVLWRRCLDSQGKSQPLYAYPLVVQVEDSKFTVTTPQESVDIHGPPAYPYLSAFKYSFLPYDFQVQFDQSLTMAMHRQSDVHTEVAWITPTDQSVVIKMVMGRGIPCLHLQQEQQVKYKLVTQGDVTVITQSGGELAFTL